MNTIFSSRCPPATVIVIRFHFLDISDEFLEAEQILFLHPAVCHDLPIFIDDHNVKNLFRTKEPFSQLIQGLPVINCQAANRGLVQSLCDELPPGKKFL